MNLTHLPIHYHQVVVSHSIDPRWALLLVVPFILCAWVRSASPDNGVRLFYGGLKVKGTR